MIVLAPALSVGAVFLAAKTLSFPVLGTTSKLGGDGGAAECALASGCFLLPGAAEMKHLKQDIALAKFPEPTKPGMPPPGLRKF